MATDKQTGIHVVLKLSDEVIAHTTTKAMVINKATVDVTDDDGDGWAEKLATVKEWSLSNAGFSTWKGEEPNVDVLYGLIVDGDTVDIVFGGKGSGDTEFTGKAIMTNINFSTGGTNEPLEFSCDLEGTGQLTMGEVST